MKHSIRPVTSLDCEKTPGSIYSGRLDRSEVRREIVKPRLKKEFNDWMFNRLPSKHLAGVIIFSLAMIFGLTMGFVKSLNFDLMELNKDKAEFDTSLLSIFALAYLPLTYKVFCAPLVDLFYWHRLGKCKTYLITCGLALSTIWFAASAKIDDLIQPEGVVKLTIIWACVFQVLVFFQCAADIFLLKICPDASKAELSMYQDLGSVSGEFLAFNIFLPLNSVKFLNKDLFKQKPLTEPLISHRDFMLFMATFTLVVVIVLLLFVGERSLEYNVNKESCEHLAKIVPRFFKRSAMTKLFIYIVAMRIFRFLVGGTMMPKLSNLGFSKADMANIDTVTFPLFFLLSFFFLKHLMVGRQMRMYHIMVILCTLILYARYFILVDYQSNSSQVRTFWLLAAISFVEKFTVRPVYLAGFVNTIAPLEVGSTFVALIMSVSVATHSLPNALGLWLVNVIPISYSLFVLVPLSLQVLLWILTTNYAIRLDFAKPELFNVTREISSQEDDPLLDSELTGVSEEVLVDVKTMPFGDLSDYIPRHKPSKVGRETYFCQDISFY